MNCTTELRCPALFHFFGNIDFYAKVIWPVGTSINASTLRQPLSLYDGQSKKHGLSAERVKEKKNKHLLIYTA